MVTSLPIERIINKECTNLVVIGCTDSQHVASSIGLHILYGPARTLLVSVHLQPEQGIKRLIRFCHDDLATHDV